MPSRLQNIFFTISVIASSYLLVLVVPSQVNGSFNREFHIVGEAKRLPGENQQLPIKLEQEIIQVKASGEEFSLSDSHMAAFLEARDEFERRFNYPFSESLKPAVPVRYHFVVPEGIRDMVDYWVAVFGRFSEDQYIFSHSDDVSLVYAVLDMAQVNAEVFGLSDDRAEAFKQQLLDEERTRIRRLLSGLSEKISSRTPLTSEERRIARLFSGNTKISLAEAARGENIRIQEGQGNRFRQAIALSGQYMEQMEKIFASKGLPRELTRIPFVESMFNIRALSSAGARGLWQFINSTGKLYLRIDSIADERLDPILSTYAAADHLKSDYQKLGSWALAINAYNTGAGRIMAAKEQLKTNDISLIIKKFEDPAYQFYSRNYYPEFLAALHVYDNYESYFGHIEKMPPLHYEFFFPPARTNLKRLADRLGISSDLMARLNPALSSSIISGISPLPSGYVVKVPEGYGKKFDIALLEMKREQDNVKWHMVDQGETIDSIAGLYGISSELLEEHNQLFPNERLKKGTVLSIPMVKDVDIAMENPTSIESPEENDGSEDQSDFEEE